MVIRTRYWIVLGLLLAITGLLGWSCFGQMVLPGPAVVASMTTTTGEAPVEPGDFIGATVDSGGWQLWLDFKSMPTNGTFAYGLGADNALTGAEKAKLTLTSQGFDDAGQPTTLARTNYGTLRIRFPTPDNAFPDVVSNVNYTRIKVALSDYVYAGDSNLSLTLLSGLYSNTLVSGATTATAVTNLSTRAYPQPVANWSWRGFRVIDETNLTLRAVAYQIGAQAGRPVRAVAFRVTDSTDTSYTNILAEMTIDSGMNDANPVPEFIAHFATNTLAPGLVRCDARVYPWIGDATSVLDTANAIQFEPTPHFCTLTNAVSYARTYAVVMAGTGSDTDGRAASEVYWATNQSPPPFATIGRAMVCILGTNTAHYARTNLGGGVIYVGDGSFGWLGSAVVATVAPAVEILVVASNGIASCAITNYASDSAALADKDIVRIKNINIGCATAPFRNLGHVWFEGCTLHDAPAQQWSDCGTAPNSYIFTGCTVTNLGYQELRGVAADNLFISLMRGTTIRKGCKSIHYFTMLGCTHPADGTETFVVSNDKASQWALTNFPCILAYNTIYGCHGYQSVGNLFGLTNGFALIQNVMEQDDGYNGSYRYSLGSAGHHYTNGIIWNNTLASSLVMIGYNDAGTAPMWRDGYTIKNNAFSRTVIKSDLYAPADAGRTGNWNVVWSVASAGNAYVNTTNLAAFPFETPGVGGFQDPYPIDNPVNYEEFILYGGFDGVSTNASPGDFRLSASSPLRTRNVTQWVLPFDIQGNARSASDPPGAFSSTP